LVLKKAKVITIDGDISFSLKIYVSIHDKQMGQLRLSREKGMYWQGWWSNKNVTPTLIEYIFSRSGHGNT
jgi:hypothetical protein